MLMLDITMPALLPGYSVIDTHAILRCHMKLLMLILRHYAYTPLIQPRYDTPSSLSLLVIRH